MTQEDKKLLLKDICARLPYAPMIYVDEKLPRLKIGTSTRIWEYVGVSNPCKPYLRPMSSMTEEEIKELLDIDKKRGIFSSRHLTWHLDGEVIDYFNSHHFDYRGLIEKGLAIEVTKENNPYD